jgi:phosphonate transport system substrate-binding protein
MASKYNLTYYPWITQHKTPQEIKENIEIFAEALQQELQYQSGNGTTVNVLEPLQVPDQISSIAQGQSQIALMNPLGFVYSRQRNSNIDAAVVALRINDRQVGESYFAQIYTHVDTGIKNLQDLKKRSMEYGTPQSTSNFIIPAFDLRSNSIHPFAAFKRVEFVGGHDTVAMAVYNKQVEAGAGHDGVIIDLANQPGYNDAKDKLVRIHRSAPIPSDPVAINVNDKSEYQQIQAALVKISTANPSNQAIKEFWGNAQGLKETNYQPYEYLLEAVSSLGLTEEDIFS